MNGTWILLVVIAAIAVTGLANRSNLQAPLVLVTIGSLASFIPGMPRLELHPHVILGVVLPPLLYSAALRFSVATFRRHLTPILRLGILTVLATAFAVALSASWLVPELTLGAALVLGAVVAPTDAVSAVAVGRKLGLPKRVIAVLTGEGLVNDATALTLFAVAVSAVAGTRVFATDSPLAFFGYEVIGGVAIGLLLATVVHLIRGRMYDSPLETVLGLVLPFTAYLAAEEIGASGVLAVVAAGLYMGHRATDASVATRIQERAVWESLDILLEMFVFAYMGLQLKFVIDEVRDNGLDVHVAFLYGFAILGVVIAVRPLWVLLHWARRRLTRSIGLDRLGRDQFSGREYLVISWAGMRGVVTLAAAGGIPFVLASGEPFPGREIVQVIAFVVAVGTLLVQGATMPALIRALNVADPYERLYTEQQTELARTISAAAARQHLTELAANPPDGVDADDLQRILDRVNRSMQSRAEAQQAEDAGGARSVRAARGGAVRNVPPLGAARPAAGSDRCARRRRPRRRDLAHGAGGTRHRGGGRGGTDQPSAALTVRPGRVDDQPYSSRCRRRCSTYRGSAAARSHACSNTAAAAAFSASSGPRGELRAAVRAAATPAVLRDGPVVLATTRTSGVPACPRVPHLEELAGHVRAHEIPLVEIREEHRQDRAGTRPGLLDRREPPVRQQLRLVRLDLQHALLPAADTVEVRLPTQVEIRVVERVVERAGPTSSGHPPGVSHGRFGAAPPSVLCPRRESATRSVEP